MTTRFAHSDRRRAATAVVVATLVPALVGFAALTIDIGVVYNTKADLQRAADAAALAAADRLSGLYYGEPEDRALEAATEIVASNLVFGDILTVDPSNDVILGRAFYNEATQSYGFNPTNVIPDSVRVTVRRSADSPNGATPLFFAGIFGMNSTNLSATATATLAPRDIAIVFDTSGSLNDDSELRHYDLTDINLYDVWDKLPGGVDDVGGLWNPEDLPPEWVEGDGSAPQAAGPAWGFMQEMGFGTMDIDSTYDPATDPGLIKMSYNQNWSDAQLENFLVEKGYIESEVDALMVKTYDTSGGYPYRVAAALGLGVWNSGHPGGLWEQMGVPPGSTGNGNDWVGSGEVNWTETIFGNSINTSKNIWLDYINNYMNKTSTYLYDANSSFKYQLGVKTFVNYLMERKFTHEDTPELAETPAQPAQAIKDGVGYMISLVEGLETSDQIALVVYATTSHLEIELTEDFAAIRERVNEMQAGYYDSLTNMGGGLATAIEELTGERARQMSRKVIVMLTDGIANVNSSGGYDPNGDGGSAYALSLAAQAADQGIQIFAITVGAAADISLMQQIAEVGDGVHFHAEGTIEEYSEGLAQIFTTIGRSRTVELIQ